MENDGRRYLASSLVAGAVHAVLLGLCLVGAAFLPTPWRWLVAAVPVLALIVAVWALARRLHDAAPPDRSVLTLSAAVAGALTVVVAFTWGIFQLAGAPALNPGLLVPVWMAGFGLSAWWSRARG